MNQKTSKTLETWIVIGDIHNHIDLLHKIPELSTAKGIIVSGDITFLGGTADAQAVLTIIEQYTQNIMAQIGNMDKPEVSAWLAQHNWDLHGKAKECFPDVWVLGLGGSTPTPFNTPSEYSEEQMRVWLDQAYLSAQKQNQSNRFNRDKLRMFLISHTPPYGTNCDRLQNGVSVGSHAVRNFIEQHQPELCVCGHIHEARSEDYLDNTHLINPGQLADGGYALVSFDSSSNTLRGELKLIPPGS